MNRLAGKVAVVTGASANIGGALARGLAAEGAAIVCTDLSEEVAQRSAHQIRADGGDAMALHGDVTDASHADEVMARALDRWGHVDVLVNNAVWFNLGGLLTLSLDDYRRQIDIIVGGSFIFTRAAAKTMIASGTQGSIINVLSTAAWQGQPGNIGYATGKGGLVNFTRSAAMELAVHGIRVNGFTPTATQPEDPGVIEKMKSHVSQPSDFAMDFVGQFPMKRLPTPDDYVGAVVFLASDEASMITGSNITVDGGATAKYWPWQPRPAATISTSM